MPRWLWITGGLIAALSIAGFLFKDAIGLFVFKTAMKPPASFSETTPPGPPDYTNLDHWAALPGRDDPADFTPSGVTDQQDTAPVDVFFIHPTTFIEGSGWNAPMGHDAADTFVDDFVMRGQASAYNGAARIFAPRYRQAQIYAFFVLDGEGTDALELAYEDVEAAFDHYLQTENGGRPFIIAGHSQGALQARWLLERRISGTPLQSQLVAAYPVGYFFDKTEIAETMPDIPVCASADETGCLVTWNATGKGYRPLAPIDNSVCVNPLTWTTGSTQGEFDANRGALVLANESLETGVADARCEGGRLHISEVRSDAYDDAPISMGPGNYHLYDYAFYWANLRENASVRTDAFWRPAKPRASPARPHEP